jgi:hypothetical protein
MHVTCPTLSVLYTNEQRRDQSRFLTNPQAQQCNRPRPLPGSSLVQYINSGCSWHTVAKHTTRHVPLHVRFTPCARRHNGACPFAVRASPRALTGWRAAMLRIGGDGPASRVRTNGGAVGGSCGSPQQAASVRPWCGPEWSLRERSGCVTASGN